MNLTTKSAFYNRKRVIIFISLTTIIMFTAVYLLQKPLFKKQYAAPEATLSLIPRNVAKSPDGSWRISQGQEVTVDIVLQSGSYQVESVEANITYDPTIISLKQTSQKPTCNLLTPLSKQLKFLISGVDNNGQGDETGQLSILCSAVSPSNTSSYKVIPASFHGVIATFQFRALTTVDNTSLSIDFNPENPRNDSAVLSYQGACCSTTDVLKTVTPFVFSVFKPSSSAHLDLISHTRYPQKDKPFEVDIVLSTGNQVVDSVDALVIFDANALSVSSITPQTLFDTYIKTPKDLNGVSITQEKGIINLSGMINPSKGKGVKGDNLLFATITFVPKISQGVTQIAFIMDKENSRNDTNISLYKKGEDILSYTIPLTMYIVDSSLVTPPKPTAPLLYIYPRIEVFEKGRSYDIEVYVSTAGKEIDAVDANLIYDKDILKISSITNGGTFSHLFTLPDKHQLPSANGSLQISGYIEPGDKPVLGDNLLIATITIIPQKTTSETIIRFDFEKIGARNDSNISWYKKGKDILEKVYDGSYSIVSPSLKIITSIKMLISLEGRQDKNISKERNITLSFLNTYFETNSITSRTLADGTLTLTSKHLQQRLAIGSYDIRIKPEGYLTRQVNLSLLDEDNIIDITDILFLAGDLDGSGKVNALDWRIYILSFNSSDELSDIDGSGKVNALDNVFLLRNWNKKDE